MTRPFQFSLLVWMLGTIFGCSSNTAPPLSEAKGDKGEREQIVHVYRLDGFYYDKPAQTRDGPFEAPAKSLRKWPILEKKQIKDRMLATEFSTAVATPANFGGAGEDCFWPGMAITVGEGDERIDAIICLECDWLYLYAQDGDADKKVLSERGHQEFAGLFAKAFPEQTKP